MAEVHPLLREGLSKAAVGRRLGMSRTTVWRLAALGQSLSYERDRTPSLLDLFVNQIALMLG